MNLNIIIRDFLGPRDTAIVSMIAEPSPYPVTAKFPVFAIHYSVKASPDGATGSSLSKFGCSIDDTMYSISHVKTGYLITSYMPSIEVARIVTAVLARLPVDWDNLTPDNSRYALDAVPEELQQWLRFIRHGSLYYGVRKVI